MKKIDAPIRATFIFLFLLSVVFGTPARAAINPQIDFYGTLQNDSGVNLTGTYNIVFRMYDAPTGGTLLATDTHTVANGNPVIVRNGKFAVVLGSGTGNSLAGINFNSSAHYVGLTINSDSEMIPRERMTAAPYAFNSEKIEGYRANQLLRYNATGSITDSASDTILTLRQNGIGNIISLFGGATEMFTVLSNGNVGIGTTSPSRDLSVAGDVQFTGGLYDSTNTAGTLGMVLQTTGTSTRWVATSSLGITGGGGITAIGPTGQTQSGATLTIATSTGSFNGLTSALTIIGSGNTLTYTPTLFGTLNNAGLTNSNISFGTGATGSDINWSASPVALGGTATLNIPNASATARGLLTNIDWTLFNGKISSSSLDTSTKLSTLITDETGSGALVFAGSPLFTGTTSFVNLTATGSLAVTGASTFATSTMTSSTIMTLNLTNALAVTSGGTGANTAAGALINLGATTVGSNIFTITNPGALTFLRINADNTVSAVATSTLGIALNDTTGILAATRGGTGLSSYATGDLIYASGANTLANRTIGTTGDVLSVVGGLPTWVATSTLGISGGSGGASTFLALTDTPDSYTANRLFFTNSGATSLTDSANLTFDGSVFGVTGSTTATEGYYIGAIPAITASTTLGSFFLAGATPSQQMQGFSYNNLAIGTYALQYLSTGLGNIAVGYEALAGSSTATMVANNNIAFGFRSLFSNSSGNSNNSFGYEALFSNESGGINNAIGPGALYSNTSGNYNNAIGPTMGSNTTGSFNNALGAQTLNDNTTGTHNNAIGRDAATRNITGSHNNALGYRALFLNLSGDFNNAIGFNALSDNITGSHNVAVGTQALYSNNGTGTIAIGHNSGYNALTVNRGIFIGSEIDAASTTENNVLNIGNLIFGSNVDGIGPTFSSGNIGIGSSSPSSKLTVAGTFRVTSTSTLAGATVTDLTIARALRDINNSAGTLGMVFQSTGTSTRWVATSTLGITGGGITAIGPTGQTQSGATITFATSTGAFNGLTSALTIIGSGNILTYTPSLTGTLNNSGIATPYLSFATTSTGTDISFTSASTTLGGTATLNVPSASATARGLLTSANFTTFNGKISSTSLDTSAKLSALITDETGTGLSVFSVSPTFNGTAIFTNILATGTLAVSGTSTFATTTIASSTITNLNLINALAATSGGTSFNTYSTGDFLYASGANALAKRTIGTTGQLLQVVGGVPNWISTSTLNIDLANTSGTLTATRGGTGLTTITQNQLLIGGAGNTWSQVATSSIGLSASFTNSSQLAALLTDETGTGLSVFSVSPTFNGTAIFTNISATGTLAVSGTTTLALVGSVGIGTSTPSAQLTTTGTVRFAAFGAGSLQTDASGNVSVSSDERLKNIQGNFTKGLEALALINPIQYTWKPTTGYDTANVYTGFSAQNIQDALPEAVGKNADGYLSLSDRPLLATVINAIKQIYVWMKTTDTRVETLETQINTMQAEIDGLKAGKIPPQQNTTNTNSSVDESVDTSTDTATTTSPPSVEEIKKDPPVIENPPETTEEINTPSEIPAQEPTTESL